MTIYDGVMLLIVVYCIFQGYWRGMAWQIAPIASLVLGYLFAVPLSVATAPYFGSPPTNQLFALVTMYILVSLAVYLVIRSVRDSIDKLKLTEFDRHLGAVLGAIKGILFTLALTLTLIAVSATARDIILKSESSTIAARIFHRLYPILPKAVTDVLEPYVQHVRPHLPKVDENDPLFDFGSIEEPDAARASVEPAATPARNVSSPRAITPPADPTFGEQVPVRPRRRPRAVIPVEERAAPSAASDPVEWPAARTRPSSTPTNEPVWAPEPPVNDRRSGTTAGTSGSTRSRRPSLTEPADPRTATPQGSDDFGPAPQ